MNFNCRPDDFPAELVCPLVKLPWLGFDPRKCLAGKGDDRSLIERQLLSRALRVLEALSFPTQARELGPLELNPF